MQGGGPEPGRWLRGLRGARLATLGCVPLLGPRTRPQFPHLDEV